VIAWWFANTSFWAGALLLVVLAVVDMVWAARRARRERQDALRRIPIARRRRSGPERGEDLVSVGGKTEKSGQIENLRHLRPPARLSAVSLCLGRWRRPAPSGRPRKRGERRHPSRPELRPLLNPLLVANSRRVL